MIRNIIFLTLSLSLSHAGLSTTPQSEPDYIDETHKTVSNKIIEWSDTIDNKISDWIGTYDVNNTQKEKPTPSTKLMDKKVQSVDEFFQNARYLDEADATFLTVRFDADFQTKESNDFKLKIGGQIPLSKSKRNFNMFLGGAPLDKGDNIQTEEDEDKRRQEIGLNYYAAKISGLESKYSVGIRGIDDPFVRARFYMTFDTENWHIEPSQAFKYSNNNKFEEETKIYFDRRFEDFSLFRTLLYRRTQEEIAGMDYAVVFQYYWSPFENTGLRVSQGFLGNTEYPYIADKNVDPPQIETFGGISDYETSLSFRQNIWRKWFFYEVRPGVNFHRDHDYEPNYTFRVLLDFHFGAVQ